MVQWMCADMLRIKPNFVVMEKCISNLVQYRVALPDEGRHVSHQVHPQDGQ
jgi:hypothetical protein